MVERSSFLFQIFRFKSGLDLGIGLVVRPQEALNRMLYGRYFVPLSQRAGRPLCET